MITRQDWFSINNIVLTMYSTDDDAEMMDSFLKAVRVLIPFNVGVYLKAESDENEIRVGTPAFIGTDQNFVDEYCKFATSSDYASPLMKMHSSIAYRDTDLLDDVRRENTVFYKEFLQKYRIPYVGGLILALHGRILGEITLYRDINSGDFKDEELEILNILRPHLDNRLYYKLCSRDADQIYSKSKQYITKCKEVNLTQRELEILELITLGYGYEEISDNLAISVNTTKKHVSNIFKKLGVSSRMELIKYFAD